MKSPSLLTVLVLAALGFGCSRPQLQSLPTLATIDPDAEINEWPLGATSGTVTVAGNCIRLQQRQQRPTLIFPPYYKLRQFKQGWAIITSQGDIWGLVGDSRKIGGGELRDDSHVLSFISKKTQEQCTGPYWLVLPEDPRELRPRNVRPPPPAADS